MRYRFSWVLVSLLLVVGCGRCSKDAVTGPSSDLVGLLPKDVEAVVLVPNVGTLGGKISVVEKLKVASFVAQLQGFSTAQELATAVMGQLGVDVRSPESLRKVGIDPSSSVAVVILPGDRAFSAVGVADAARFKEWVAGLAKGRLGTGTVSEVSPGLWHFSKTAGGPPSLGVLMKAQYAFVAPQDSVDVLPKLATLNKEQALSQDPLFPRSIKRLPSKLDALAYFPESSALGRRGTLAGGAVGMALTESALTFSAALQWPNTQESLKVLEKQTGETPYSLLPPEAFFVAQFSGDPKRLAPLLPHVLGTLEPVLKNAGVDVREDILGIVKPGAILSLSLSPEAKMTGMPALDVRRTNPFRYVHLVGAAAVHDAKKAESALAKAPILAPHIGARVEAQKRGDQTVYVTSYAQGEGVHWALSKDRVVFAAPMARFEEALGRATSAMGGGAPSDPALRKVLEEAGFAAVIDLRKLAAAVKELPSEAWGVGGFAIKATTVRWLEATDDLGAIVSTVSAKDGAIFAELSLRLVKP